MAQKIKYLEDYPLNKHIVSLAYCNGYEVPTDREYQGITSIMQGSCTAISDTTLERSLNVCFIGLMHVLNFHWYRMSQAMIIVPNEYYFKLINHMISAYIKNRTHVCFLPANANARTIYVNMQRPYALIVATYDVSLKYVGLNFPLPYVVIAIDINEAKHIPMPFSFERWLFIFRKVRRHILISKNTNCVIPIYYKIPYTYLQLNQPLKDGIVKHSYAKLQDNNEKLKAIDNIFAFITINQCVIYCSSDDAVDTLVALFRKQPYHINPCYVKKYMLKDVHCINMSKFKDAFSRLCIININCMYISRAYNIYKNCSHIINFDFVTDRDVYSEQTYLISQYKDSEIINFITKGEEDQFSKLYTTGPLKVCMNIISRDLTIDANA